MFVKEVDDLQKNLKKFYNRNKKAVIIGAAVAVVATGLGAGMLFNQTPSNNGNTNALNNPTSVNDKTEKNVTREDVQISTLSNFDILTTKKLPEGFSDASNVWGDSARDGMNIEGRDGVWITSDNVYDEKNVNPVCGIKFAIHQKSDVASQSYETWYGDTLEEIAENAKATRDITYPNWSTVPVVSEKVTDLKVASLDGTKNYLIPTMKYSSPNGGLVKYFGAQKLQSGDIVAVQVKCFDMHASEGFAGAQPLPNDEFDKMWKILDTVKIEPVN